MKQQLFTTYANRFSPSRKKAFRNAMVQELESYGYEVTIHKTIFGTNLYFGNIDAPYILTAHYDTATNMAVVYPFIKIFGARLGQVAFFIPLLILGIIAPNLYFTVFPILLLIVFIGLLIPNKHNFNDNSSGVLTILRHAEEHRESNNFFYAFTDNEEKGLFGAKVLRSYLKEHGRIGKILNINIDCVGVGDFFAVTSSMNSKYLDYAHNKCSAYRDLLKIKSKLLSSDHLLFGNKGVMITKVCKASLTKDVYLPNLHTNKDNQIEECNIHETLILIKQITGESN